MFEEVSGLMGGSMVLSLLMLLFGSIPVLIGVFVKQWGNRLKALAIYGVVIGGLFGLAVGVMGVNIVLGIMAFIGGAIYLFVAGLIAMIIALYIAKPVLLWGQKKYKLR